MPGRRDGAACHRSLTASPVKLIDPVSKVLGNLGARRTGIVADLLSCLAGDVGFLQALAAVPGSQ